MRPPKSSTAVDESTSSASSTRQTHTAVASSTTTNVSSFENLVLNLSIPLEQATNHLTDDRPNVAKKCFLLINNEDDGDDSDSDENHFLLNNSSCCSSLSAGSSFNNTVASSPTTAPAVLSEKNILDNRNLNSNYNKKRTSVASLYNYYSNQTAANNNNSNDTLLSESKLIKRSETYSGNKNNQKNSVVDHFGGFLAKHDSGSENFHRNTSSPSITSTTTHVPDTTTTSSNSKSGSTSSFLVKTSHTSRLKRVSSDITQKLSDISKLNYNNRHNSCVQKNSSDYKLSDNAINNQIIVNQLEQFYALANENSPLITQTACSPATTPIKQDSLISVRKGDVSSLIFTKKIDNKLIPIVHKRIKKVKDRKFLEDKRKSLQLPVHQESVEENLVGNLSKLRHSWYGVEYNTVREEELEDNLEDSELNFQNLAGAKSHNTNGAHESASLLDTHQQSKLRGICIQSNQQQSLISEGPHALPSSLGGPAPRKRRFEQFLKSLVGRRPSKEPITPPTPPSLLPSPELKVTKSPSVHNLSEFSKSAKINSSTSSLNSVHQKIWSVVPLLKRDSSCNSVLHTTKSSNHLAPPKQPFLRKCETVLALSNSQSHLEEPIRPLNRLRNCASVATCSRCSSLLSLAADGSKYSLNTSNGGFVTVDNNQRASSSESLQKLTEATAETSQTPPPVQTNVRIATPTITTMPITKFTCKLCLGDYNADSSTKIEQCGCSFCTECMAAYIEFEISEGAYEVSCPDAMCPSQGVISISEITALAALSLVEKHHRYRLNREVELDKFRTWCPKAGCETICLVGPSTSAKAVSFQPSSSSALQAACAVHCPTCRDDFCSGCKKPWHPTMSCEENTRRLAADGQNDDNLGIPFDSDLIKCCPMCAVPIEKDEGCAQMMCKRCKHVFCWYCLASLDDDFLLRHYDKGPCKNKLGHSRASVVWHRAQVIGIFAGFGILLLVASPLLLLAAPCIVCCKCRICSGAAKLEDNDVDYDDAIALQR